METKDWLKGIASDMRVETQARTLATKLLRTLNSNIVPSLGELRRLRKMLEKVEPCARIREDGSCAWLRKHARLEGVSPAGPGQRMLCHRRGKENRASSFESCHGYKKGGEE